MKNAEIPGAVWLLLLVIIPDVSQWLNEYFGEVWWIPAVAALLLILYKGYLTVKEATTVQEPVNVPPGVDSMAPLPPQKFDDLKYIKKFAIGG